MLPWFGKVVLVTAIQLLFEHLCFSLPSVHAAPDFLKLVFDLVEAILEFAILPCQPSCW